MNESSAKNVIVCYASATGFSYDYACKTSEKLNQYNLPNSLVPLESLTKESLQAADFVFFCVSTYTDGYAPPDAREWQEQHMTNVQPYCLSFGFSMISLGDKAYEEDFCKFGDDLLAWLINKGAVCRYSVKVNCLDDEAIDKWFSYIDASCNPLQE